MMKSGGVKESSSSGSLRKREAAKTEEPITSIEMEPTVDIWSRTSRLSSPVQDGQPPRQSLQKWLESATAGLNTSTDIGNLLEINVAAEATHSAEVDPTTNASSREVDETHSEPRVSTTDPVEGTTSDSIIIEPPPPPFAPHPRASIEHSREDLVTAWNNISFICQANAEEKQELRERFGIRAGGNIADQQRLRGRYIDWAAPILSERRAFWGQDYVLGEDMKRRSAEGGARARLETVKGALESGTRSGLTNGIAAELAPKNASGESAGEQVTTTDAMYSGGAAGGATAGWFRGYFNVAMEMLFKDANLAELKRAPPELMHPKPPENVDVVVVTLRSGKKFAQFYEPPSKDALPRHHEGLPKSLIRTKIQLESKASSEQWWAGARQDLFEEKGFGRLPKPPIAGAAHTARRGVMQAINPLWLSSGWRVGVASAVTGGVVGGLYAGVINTAKTAPTLGFKRGPKLRMGLKPGPNLLGESNDMAVYGVKVRNRNMPAATLKNGQMWDAMTSWSSWKRAGARLVPRSMNDCLAMISDLSLHYALANSGGHVGAVGYGLLVSLIFADPNSYKALMTRQLAQSGMGDFNWAVFRDVLDTLKLDVPKAVDRWNDGNQERKNLTLGDNVDLLKQMRADMREEGNLELWTGELPEHLAPFTRSDDPEDPLPTTQRLRDALAAARWAGAGEALLKTLSKMIALSRQCDKIYQDKATRQGESAVV